MSPPFFSRNSRVSNEQARSGSNDETPDHLPAERLHRLAALIAVGTAPIPSDLAPADLSLVLAEVARLRRKRLVGFIATAIAMDIHRSHQS